MVSDSNVMPWREWVQGPGGFKLAVWEWGNPTGPVLVLVHGVAQSHLSFKRQMKGAVAETCRVIALDLLGHGESEKPLPGPYEDGQCWADQLAAVIAAKKLKNPVLAGWSMGGRVVRQYLMHYGDGGIAGVNFISSRVIEDPASPGGNGRSMAAGSAQPAASERIEMARKFLETCFHRRPPDTDFEEMLVYNLALPHAARRQIAAWSTPPASTLKCLQHLRVPVLASHGLEDRVIPVSIAYQIAEAVPRAQLSLYPLCGHAPFFEAPARFNHEMAEFVLSAQTH